MKERISIWNDMKRMQQQMESMFDTFFSGGSFFGKRDYLLEEPLDKGKNTAVSNYINPLTDIWETDKEVIAEVEMPGIDKKDIKVHVGNDGIEIKAVLNTETKHENKKKGMYKLERNYSGFSRYFSLPDNVDTSKANAEYKKGILKITVPKIEVEEHKKKLLDIK